VAAPVIVTAVPAAAIPESEEDEVTAVHVVVSAYWRAAQTSHLPSGVLVVPGLDASRAQTE